ncbi:MAG TPA: ABC transporter permease [Limnochordales bacterium]
MKRSVRIQMVLMDNLIWVIVVAFFLINAFVTPRFATPTNIINILYHSSIMSMLVLGQGLVLINGRLDLSLESTLAFAVGGAILLTTRTFPALNDPYIQIALTLLIGVLIGLFNGFCIAKLKINPFLQTLASMIVLRGLMLYLVPMSIFPLNRVYTYLGAGRMWGNIPVSVPLVILTFVAFHLLLQRTPFGRQFIATGGNPRASYISGVNVDRITIYAYVLAGLLAALAGLLAAGRQGSVTNTMGEGMVLLAFAGALLGGASLQGGAGTPLGMLGGALLLAMFSNALNLLGVGVHLVYASKGALIFVALLIDQARIRWRNRLLHREQMERLSAAGVQDAGAVEAVRT